MELTLKQIRDAIIKLDDVNKHRLLSLLDASVRHSLKETNPILKEIKERKHKDGFVCPFFSSHSVVRFGSYTTMVNGNEVTRQR